MATPFKLTVLTPEKAVLDAEVEYIQVPGMLGYMGILAHHAAIISVLDPGKMTVRSIGGGETVYAVGGGFIEVSDNEAVVLADSLEPLDAIDIARAQKSADRARERLAEAARDASIDKARADTALRRALNRMAIRR